MKRKIQQRQKTDYIGKSVSKMQSIKIYTKSQLILLRNINHLLGKYRIPREVLKQVESVLADEKVNGYGFVIIILTIVRDDITEIEDAANVYPAKVIFNDSIKRLDITDNSYEMTKGREWYMNSVQIKGTKNRVYILYSLLKKELYGHN